MQELIYVDVGARWGNNTRMSGGSKYNLDTYFSHIISYGFEPDPEEFSRLEQTDNSIYYHTALGKKKGFKNLYIMKSPDWSSFYKPLKENSDQFEGVSDCNIVDHSVKVKIDKLDNILCDADFIKIDTEGSELDVLEGGSNLLGNKIMCAEIEVYFYPIRENQPTFGDIDKFMLDNKFQMFNISRNRYMRKGFDSIWLTKGQVLWGDVLYLKDYRYVNDVDNLIKLYYLSLVFGYPDYAESIRKKLTDLLPNSEYTFRRD